MRDGKAATEMNCFLSSLLVARVEYGILRTYDKGSRLPSVT